MVELQEKEQQLIEQKEQTQEEKDELLEKTLLSQFPVNTQCIYYGKIDNKDTVGGSLIKFGMSNNLQERVKKHKKTYTNFRLTNVFKVSNQIAIENCIKKHEILKKRIRNIIIDNMNYRELLCIDQSRKEPDFTLEKLNNYIKQIIEETEYNIDNYNKLLLRNEELEIEFKKLDDINKNLKKENDKLQEQLNKFNVKNEENFKLNRSETINGYSMFAFSCTELRHKVGICKTLSLEVREKCFKASNKHGKIVSNIPLKHSFLEKILLNLLKRHLVFLNNDTFDGSIDDINMIFNICSKLENLIINNDLYNILKVLNGETIETINNDPETPFVKKAKRPVDQIDPITGNVIATYPSIEQAGKKGLNLTTGTAVGIALRNKSLCQGFLWRYSGISAEDQMKDQPVIRIKCESGEKTFYPNIASAARDAKISPPGLRNRLLTDVHVGGYHWVFDKSATHYSFD
jgi:hypothetical protein